MMIKRPFVVVNSKSTDRQTERRRKRTNQDRRAGKTFEHLQEEE
jgi:hypothetical protein